MPDDIKQLNDAQAAVFKIQDMLKAIVSEKSQIGKEPINEFNILISNLDSLAEIFFKKFNGSYIEQIVTYGSIKTTTEICIALRDNLVSAHERHENPIAAERVIDKNYLDFTSVILGSLEKVYTAKKIDNEEYSNINGSVRIMFKRALEDRILKQGEIRFKNKASANLFADVINTKLDF
jgi:hypothetical protein